MTDVTDAKITSLPRLNLRDRQLCDLEMLLVGGFEPLTGFMNEAEYDSVVADMRLTDGALFPIPIVLDVPNSSAFAVGDEIVLCDEYGNPLAIMSIESRYQPDKEKEVKGVYGTNDRTHPGVAYVMRYMMDTYLGGRVTPIGDAQKGLARSDFKEFRHTPEELKSLFKEHGWDEVVAFQTRNPMHRVHFELVKRAHEKTGAPVLIHPVVGMTKEGDIDYVTRVRTYKAVRDTYGKEFTELSLLPLAMRMAGPREALWHALIRKNYGCTHFIVGRDHAGPGNDAAGNPFYSAYEARELAEQYATELEIIILPSDELAYIPTKEKYLSTDELGDDDEAEHISGTEFRRKLFADEEIPEWFSFPECIVELKKSAFRQKHKGMTLFFTGLSGAGKSTLATALASKLLEVQDKNITLLDGDIIRDHLSKGLTFSKEDRDTNVTRVGYVASEITKHGGIAITSLIAPYRDTRQTVRELVGRGGHFIEIFVATPLGVCEDRDTKGLYKKAREGLIKDFTGIDDPYEEPVDPELVIDTTDLTVDVAVDQIVTYLKEKDLIVVV